MLTKQETLLGRGAWAESQGEGAQEDCSALGFNLGFYGSWVSFQVVSISFSDSGSFLVVHIAQLRLIPARGVWEVGRTYRLTSLSFRPLLNSSGW